MRRSFVLAATALLAVSAACGGGANVATSTPSAAASAAATTAKPETADERMARLYEAAKAEGKVAFYSSMNTDDGKKVFPAFEAKFPGLKVEHTRQSGEQLVQKLVTEKKAGQDLFDVLETNLFESLYVIQQGYTQKYAVASAGDMPAEARAADGSWIAARLNNDIPGINTTKVKPGDIKTWQDLCDPKYKGHIAIEQSDVVVYSAFRKVLGDQKAQDLLKCLAANQPSLRSGHTDMANLLAAGEFWVTLSSNGHVLGQLKYEKGAPIDWVRTDPIITDVQAMALSNKPPHPNAAKLFMEWLTSPDGQKAVASTGRVPASTKVPPKYPDLDNFAKIYYIQPALRDDFDKDSAFWRSTLGIK